MSVIIIRLIVSGLLFGVSFFIPPVLDVICLICAYLVIGYDVLARAGRNIIKGKALDEAFLMSIATIGAFAIGEFPEAVMVMFLYQVGECFADFAVDKARDSVNALAAMLPDTVNVLRDGAAVTVKPSEVNVGETVVAKPGEKIALDGIIIDLKAETADEKNTSAEQNSIFTFDTKALTGESVPRELRLGDSVLSGFVNLSNTVCIKVTKPETESAAAVIARLTEESADKKAKSELFITKFSKVYTPSVVILAVLIAAVPMLITGRFEAGFLNRALSFLVVSCPCALVISVPLAYFAGIGAASKRGVLIKGGAVIDRLVNVSDAVFDKTGTLTTGDFSVTEITAANGFRGEDVIKWAAEAESGSNHPIAKAIVRYYNNVYGKKPAADVSVRDIPGVGIVADTSYGEVAVKKSDAGIEVSINGKTAGYITVSDTPRSTSADTIKILSVMNVTSHMLTGDRKDNADNTARIIGIADVRSDLLPAGKVEAFTEIKKTAAGGVIFVGDGINDAPVLALSDCGFAMGGLGQAAAVETADAVIADDDPAKVITALKISRNTRNIAVQNITFSLIVKFAVLILSALGLTGIDTAVFADVGVSVLAVLNAMRAGKIRN
jgi:Cd2+/Zn2+-exporting ATPase